MYSNSVLFIYSGGTVEQEKEGGGGLAIGREYIIESHSPITTTFGHYTHYDNTWNGLYNRLYRLWSEVL